MLPLPLRQLGRPAAFGLALLLPTACSSPSTSAAPDATAAVPGNPPVKPRDFGTAVDSLAGLPGHRFGQPLSAFPGLKRGEGGGPLLLYSYPAGGAQDKSWFAKHRGEVPGVFYKFKEGKFASFQAVAYSPEGQAALAQEARFLFGPGRQLGDRTEWNGQQAWAILSSSFIYGRPVRVLEVSSHALLDAPSAGEQQRLREENAH